MGFESMIFDSTNSAHAIMHITKSDGKTRVKKQGNPIIFLNVKFQNINTNGAVIVSDASPLTLYKVHFANVKASKLIELGYGEKINWQDASVFSSTFCPTSSFWVPFFGKNIQKTNTGVTTADIVWDENIQPIVAILNNSSYLTSPAIVQARDLSIRKGVFLNNGCSQYFPNCCQRIILDDISKSKVSAGIVQIGENFLKKKTTKKKKKKKS